MRRQDSQGLGTQEAQLWATPQESTFPGLFEWHDDLQTVQEKNFCSSINNVPCWCWRPCFAGHQR